MRGDENMTREANTVPRAQKATMLGLIFRLGPVFRQTWGR